MRRNYFSHVARPQSLVRVDRARAWHPAPRGAKNIPALAAYRREVRRTRSLPVRQNSNVRVRARGFFACRFYFWIGYEEHALARPGPCASCLWRPALAQGQAVGRGQHPLLWPVDLMKTEFNDPCPTSRPPFAPRQGSAEASAAAPGSTPAKRPGSVQADAAAHSSIAGTKVFPEHSPLATRERQRARCLLTTKVG